MKTNEKLSRLQINRFLMIYFLFLIFVSFKSYSQQSIRENFLVETVSRHESATNYATANFVYDDNHKLLYRNITGEFIQNSQLRDLNYVDEFEYENDLVSKIKVHDNTFFMFSHELHFSYNDQNQVIRKETWKDGIMIDHVNYYYQNNRLVSVYHDDTSPLTFSIISYNEQNNVPLHIRVYPATDISGQPIPGEFITRELTYTYDNNPKPNFGLDYLVGYQPFPWLGSIVDVEMLLSTNNMTKAISQEQTYNYTYNEHGLPETLHDIFDPIGPSPDLIYTINYTQIGTLSLPQISTPNVIIYPNPFENVVYIESDFEGTLSLYDMLGRKILNQAFDKKAEINTSQFASGTYHILLISKDEKTTLKNKLIKK